MSLKGFQAALCDLIASPELCLEMRQRAEEVLSRYELSSRERRRLADIVHQPGMSTSCTLYRVNRITPLYTLLPLTCFLLGDDLVREAQTFWDEFAATDLQYQPEIERFAEYLHQRVAVSRLGSPFLTEVINFELAVNALQMKSRRRIPDARESRKKTPGRLRLQLNPLVRLLRFRHDPVVLLQKLGERTMPSDGMAEGDFFLLLDGRDRDLEVVPIDARLGRLIQAIDDGGSPVGPRSKIRAVADLFVAVEHDRSAAESL